MSRKLRNVKLIEVDEDFNERLEEIRRNIDNILNPKLRRKSKITKIDTTKILDVIFRF